MKLSWITGLLATLAIGVQALLLDVQPRLMWGWQPDAHGYCGSASLQSAGLFYGNYFSQEQVRYAGGNKEILIDVNLHTAADALALTYEQWTPSTWNGTYGHGRAASFPVWMKDHLDAQHPVIMGLFERQPGGDPDYDHIVPMIGYDMDKFYLYFNDLYEPVTRPLKLTDIKTRANCHQAEPPVQPYSYCFPTPTNYGLAVTGNKDSDGTYPVMLKIQDSGEPDWGAEDNLHQKPVEFSPRAIISGLTVGKSYSLLRFDSTDALPQTEFINGSWSERVVFVASGETHEVVPGSIMSDGVYLYRCVEV